MTYFLAKDKIKDDLHLCIKVAIASGHWERLSDAIERTWHRRNSEELLKRS